MADEKTPDSFLPDYLKADVPPVGEADRLIMEHSKQKFSSKVTEEVKDIKGLAEVVPASILTQSTNSVGDKKPKLPKLVIHEESAEPKKIFPDITAVAEEFHGVDAKPYKEGSIKVSDIKSSSVELNSGLPPRNKPGRGK